MRNFPRKWQGRIYVTDKSHIEIVKNEIKLMDEFEYDYIPDDLIAPFSEYPKCIYTGKFDFIDLDELTARLWAKRVYIFCMVGDRG